MNEITEDSMFVVGPSAARRPGRPRVSSEPMERIDVRIPVSDYDRLIKLAMSRGESVASLTRTLLRLRMSGISSVKTR